MTDDLPDQKEKNAVVLWASFFFNPLAEKESRELQKGLTTALQSLQPDVLEFEELTSFLLLKAKFLSTSFSSNLSSFFETITRRTELIYHDYLIKLQDRFLTTNKKNREVTEAMTLLVRRLQQSDEQKNQFNEQYASTIDAWANKYIQVCQKADVLMAHSPQQNHFQIDLNRLSFQIKSDKQFSYIVDELILYNFSQAYVVQTNVLIRKLNHSLEETLALLQQLDKKSGDFEEALQLLKGKSFELAENLTNLRRQLARQKRAEDELMEELDALNKTSFHEFLNENLVRNDIKEINQLTDVVEERLEEWFELIRRFELMPRENELGSPSQKLILAINDLFINMELVRVWTELFYDITYFTSRQAGIIADFNSVQKQPPKILEEALLVVNNAHKTYVLPAARVYALRGVSFIVKPGEFIAIMGPSGAGKTTLINVITGLDSLDKGEVYLNGRNIALMDDKHLTEFRRDQIGLVFQFYQLFGELTALENVTMPAEMAGVPIKEVHEKGLEILRSVGLEKFAHQYPDKLSGGQQQRVAIARALINDPAVIVADQITGDLDSGTGQQVINLLKKFNREEGKTILLATHNKTVARQADRILHIEDGEIIEETDMKQLRAADDGETDVFTLAKAKKSLER